MSTVNVHLALSSGEWARGGRVVEDANRRIGDSASVADKGVSTLGRTIKSALVGFGIERFFRGILSASGDFEQGLKGVGKTAGIEGAALRRRRPKKSSRAGS